MSLLQSPIIAERILTLAFNSFIILLLTWILVRLSSQKAAPLRSGIIFTATVILLLLPILNSVDLMPGIPSITTVLPLAISNISPSTEQSKITTSLNPNDSPLIHSALSSSPRNLKQRLGRLFTSNQSGTTIIKIINGLGIIWIVGSFVLLIKLLYGIVSLRKFKKNFEEIRDRRILDILETAEESFTNHPRASVFASRKVFSPLAFGIFKPLVILPQGLHKKLNDSEIRGILLHELSHIYHKDQISGILQRLASAIHWWNPIVYSLSADFSRAREEISDNHVLLENDKKEYAECLINLAERTSLISRLPVWTGMASPHFPLKDRVKNILSKERRMDTRLNKTTICMIAFFAFFIVGATAGHRLNFAAATDNNAKESLAAIQTEPSTEVRAVDEAKALPEPMLQEKTEKTDKEKRQERKIVKPKLIKKVDAAYPTEAKEAGIEGNVIVEGVTVSEGKVIKTKILRGEHEILNNAAMAAVKQWEYEPFIINGKPIGIEFTVTLKFRLKEKDEAITIGETTTAGASVDVIRLPEDVELKLIKKVEPIYPVEARKKLLGGKILLEAIIDKQGNVLNVKVLEGEHEILNDAAIGAVKQWKYEPYTKEGKAQKVRYKIEIEFHVR
jgi:TonB family protein